MKTNQNLEPSFIETFLQDSIDVMRSKGALHLVPYLLVFFFGIGGAAAHFFPHKFFTEEGWEVAAVVYSGILAFNAITLALSWTAIGRTLEIISHPGFSSFLRAAGMLNKYSFYVTFIHLTQIFASTMTLIGLITMFIELPIEIHQTVLACVIGGTFYALRWSIGAVRVTRDLIFRFAKYDGLDEKEKQALRVVVNNENG